eukprot:TRINITY_DN50181_c0_g1_i1.p1 TRINITY_DN50181_c0_g1~~TRINITY_DN50181_c0_g1_i1.p1  ORF type:complete len:820 (-),score=222.62 TRINITY_DN50181_c0_g1_i1:50-2509(-)
MWSAQLPLIAPPAVAAPTPPWSRATSSTAVASPPPPPQVGFPGYGDPLLAGQQPMMSKAMSQAHSGAPLSKAAHVHQPVGASLISKAASPASPFAMGAAMSYPPPVHSVAPSNGGLFPTPAPPTAPMMGLEEIRRRLVAIYKVHKADNVEKVDHLLLKYATQEYYLYQSVCQKYNVNDRDWAAAERDLETQAARVQAQAAAGPAPWKAHGRRTSGSSGGGAVSSVAAAQHAKALSGFVRTGAQVAAAPAAAAPAPPAPPAAKTKRLQEVEEYDPSTGTMIKTVIELDLPADIPATPQVNGSSPRADSGLGGAKPVKPAAGALPAGGKPSNEARRRGKAASPGQGKAANLASHAAGEAHEEEDEDDYDPFAEGMSEARQLPLEALLDVDLYLLGEASGFFGRVQPAVPAAAAARAAVTPGAAGGALGVSTPGASAEPAVMVDDDVDTDAAAAAQALAALAAGAVDEESEAEASPPAATKDAPVVPASQQKEAAKPQLPAETLEEEPVRKESGEAVIEDVYSALLTSDPYDTGLATVDNQVAVPGADIVGAGGMVADSDSDSSSDGDAEDAALLPGLAAAAALAEAAAGVQTGASSAGVMPAAPATSAGVAGLPEELLKAAVEDDDEESSDTDDEESSDDEEDEANEPAANVQAALSGATPSSSSGAAAPGAPNQASVAAGGSSLVAAGGGRASIVREVFRILDPGACGWVSSHSMRRFATLNGFEGNEREWQDEFENLCQEWKCNPNEGFPEATFGHLVSDDSVNGCYCSDEELQGILEKLKKGLPEALTARAAAQKRPPAGGVVAQPASAKVRRTAPAG